MANNNVDQNKTSKFAPGADTNFMLVLLQAISHDQATLSQTQIDDAESANFAATLESNTYEAWNGPDGPLAHDTSEISKWASKAGDHGDKGRKAASEAQYWQSKYNADSSKASSAETRADGMVQSDQGQTSSDATNMQMKAQMVESMNDIQSALSNMLGKIEA